MRFAVISDTHLGHNFGTELEDDSFEAFEEALDKALAREPDFILLPGDIFDTRTPKQEVWARALKLFQKPLLARQSSVRLVGFTGEQKKVSDMALKGVPVIAIHGTHEKRAEHLVNPVELLEQAGYLIHLHKNAVILEKDGERVAVHGFSGVSERDVNKELSEWNPKPVEGAFNVFVFHQSLKEEIFDADNEFISVNDLPLGFDLYIDGHIHWRKWYADKKLLIPGSTILTQQKEKEAVEGGKGFFMIDSKQQPLAPEFAALEKQRRLFFKKIIMDNAKPYEIIEKVREFLASLPKSEKKPLVKIKLIGKLAPGSSTSINLSEFKNNPDFVVSIDNELEAEELKTVVEKLRKLQQEKKSVDEIGMSLLEKLLSQTDYKGPKPESLIEALAEGEVDRVLDRIIAEAEKE